MRKWEIIRASTSISVSDYLMSQAKRPIGIYVFGVDEVRTKVALRVQSAFNRSGEKARLLRSMFSIPHLADDQGVTIIDLSNIVSREYSSSWGASGGKVATLPNCGLRRECADRLYKAGANTVVAVYAKVTNPDHLLNSDSIACSDYLRKNRPEADSPCSGDYLVVVEEDAIIC